MANAVKTAKDALVQAVTKYACCKSALQKSIDSTDPVSARTLNIKSKKLDDALQDLNVLHTAWVLKAEFSDDDLAEEKYSRQWLENEWSQCDDLQDQTEVKLALLTVDSTPPVPDNNSRLLILNKQMESLQLEISSKVDNLSSRSSGETTPSSHKLYTEMLSDVKDTLSRVDGG